MKISKKSWHYRWLLFMNQYKIDNMPKSLCGYFWSLVISLFGVPVFFVAVSPVILFGCICAGLYYSYWWIVDKYKNHRDKKRIARGEPVCKHREPSLFRKWLKAKKEKVCPLIEFTEE